MRPNEQIKEILRLLGEEEGPDAVYFVARHIKTMNAKVMDLHKQLARAEAERDAYKREIARISAANTLGRRGDPA